MKLFLMWLLLLLCVIMTVELDYVASPAYVIPMAITMLADLAVAMIFGVWVGRNLTFIKLNKPKAAITEAWHRSFDLRPIDDKTDMVIHRELAIFADYLQWVIDNGGTIINASFVDGVFRISHTLHMSKAELPEQNLGQPIPAR